jgi:hypothetical protein
MVCKGPIFDHNKGPKNDSFLNLENQRLFCPIVTFAQLEASSCKYDFVLMFVTLGDVNLCVMPQSS